ncbi:MAG: hypothetical protein GYB65_22890 [Chloroflexi bacterium]|nr:hypothetical protein [Chloroflexota bacterium]
MSASLSIRKVESRADFTTLLRFPWAVYKGDPHWVPPLVSMQRHKLDQRQNVTWQHMTGDYYIAWRGEQPVGTIAAFVNHRLNEFQGENTGFFGQFELVDDQQVATALLEKAADVVQGLGCDVLRGPATFSTNEECGLLVEGFDDPPLVLMPYNLPYYQRLIEGVPGFEKAMDIYSYYITLEAAVAAEEKFAKLLRVVEKNNARRTIEVQQLDARNMKSELAKLRDIYNTAWEKNWNFVPLSDGELDEMIANLGRFIEPSLTYFATVNGEPAAFLLGIPDLNQALLRAYPRPGKPEVLSLLQVLWHWKVRRTTINRLRVPLMGVKEGYRNIGVESALFLELYRAALRAADRWEYADGGWVLETNLPIQRLVEAYNSRVYKRHRFYERQL